MAVCVLIQLILVQTGSVFGFLGTGETVRGTVFITVVWVWQAVCDCSGCWGSVMFVVGVGFRAIDVVIGMEQVSVA